MKHFSVLNKGLNFLFICFIAMGEVLAQESSSISIDEEIGSIIIDKGPFYAQLWFWIVIGLFFLILLILLVRSGNSGKDEKKVVEQEEKLKDAND